MDWSNINIPQFNEDDYKMMLCVRMDVPMGVGKKCAQCGHAAVGCYQVSMEKAPQNIIKWQNLGEKKICVKIQNMEEWNHIVETCKELGILYYEVKDAGKTQVAPGTKTVLGIGPGPGMLIDVVTGHLNLL
ncbi:peptidyl-tRNA hydrolase [Entamoeba marina]